MTGDPTHVLLLYIVVAVLFTAGVADWLCDRASDIEHTTGAKESPEQQCCRSIVALEGEIGDISVRDFPAAAAIRADQGSSAAQTMEQLKTSESSIVTDEAIDQGCLLT